EAAISSASWPVPSGELSSTTRMSILGSCCKMAGTTSGRLGRSLYVGTTTSSRSATSRTKREGRAAGSRQEHDDPGCRRDGGSEIDDLRAIPQDHPMLTASAQ